MAFTQEQPQTPAAIGAIRITLIDIPDAARAEIVTFSAFDTPQVLSNAPNPGTLTLESTDPPGTIYTAGVDYSVDYVAGTITALGGGALEIGPNYNANYEARVKAARYEFAIEDAAGNVIRGANGDLRPHLTGPQLTSVSDFLDAMRTKAEAEVIGS